MTTPHAGENAAKCGTPSGYSRHLKQGEPRCDACKAAWAEYQRAYRASDPRHREKRAKNEAARMRALWRLRKEFPKRYQELYNEERRAGWRK